MKPADVRTTLVPSGRADIIQLLPKVVLNL